MTDNCENTEGTTPLDPDELEGLRYTHITNRGELNELEQANIVEGLQWLQKLKTRDLLTEKFVLDLHQHLFGQVWEWAGSFRKTEKNIGVDPVQISIQLKQLLDDTNYWIEKDTYSAKELAARFHHKLVFIHPFANGNGRHARIMADAILTKIMNVAAIDWSGGYRLDAMNQRRQQYIGALKAADRYDFDQLLKFVGISCD